MSEAFGLVNADSGFPGPDPQLCLSETPFSRRYSGRTVALTLKLEAANGWTRARLSWASMQLAEDLPAAAPFTVTCRTRPSEPNTTTALDGASSPATQWRAPPITEPSAT